MLRHRYVTGVPVAVAHISYWNVEVPLKEHIKDEGERIAKFRWLWDDIAVK